MLTALYKLLSSYNSDDVAYRAKFKDADASVYKKKQRTNIFYLFSVRKK